ncbi:biotin transporter BioY [Varunaivibrio sulfuroxidans]|uniref:Biotin transporter n=1 Tax=Varunaivibrio sulfuroxidans TaxID=1773489 RepID=A0A4R3JBF6_9PROT|nr:biotin transporter BioY [Varunaivibrio sulfuroxidans]TCS62957.1 biotin transport system substrate-specific component [Varunaivibrio sulfuroxidans]WES31965.1 biotin transporter BioY [Varunaivibrio sulfuroxidans]
MTNTTARHPLIHTAIPALNGSPARRMALHCGLALVGTLFIALSSRIEVPFYPVPMTLQTLAVMVIAAVYGGRLGFATLALYLMEGALGLPVFSGTPERGVGLVYMTGPTGGYLLGFLLAAGLVGWFAERRAGKSLLPLAGMMAAGLLVVYAFGATWLATFTGWDKAFTLGVAPFILGDVLKIALAAALVKASWSRLSKRAS